MVTFIETAYTITYIISHFDYYNNTIVGDEI